MAASADELLKSNDFQIPLIDLKRFCQDELNTAARLFGDFPETECNNMVSPKIDKSIFNESAGSRRQTYSGGRVSRRRKEPIPNSHAMEDSPEISMSSLVNFSSSRGKLGTNKNSSKSVLDLVGKFLYIFNKEEKNRLSARSSFSSYASEERDVLSVPLFKELKEEVHNKDVSNGSPHIQKAENICEILKGDPEMEGGILEIQKSFENAEGLEEYQSKVLDNARSDMPNARKTPQVSKQDSELKGGMGRFKVLAEGFERSQEDQNKVAVDSSSSLALSGNASEVLGRHKTGGIWGTRKLPETSEEGQHKAIVNASPHLLVDNCTSEVLRGSLEMEVDIGEIKKSFESFEGLQVSDEIIEHSGYVRPEQESKMSGEGKIYTQHGLQVQSQERKSYEQVQLSLIDFDRLVEASELQNGGKVYEKQSQVDNICAEIHSYMLNAEGDADTFANGMDGRKRKRGRPKKKATEWGSAFSIDIKKADCEKEFASDAMNQAAEHLASGSRKRVQSGFPCSALEEDAGVHVSSSSRKRVCSGLSRGASKDGNETGVKSQFYHRKFSSQAVTLEGKEVSSDANVAGDVKMLAEGLERSQEDQNKVAVDSSSSLAESGNASEVLGRYKTGGIWGTRKLPETSEEGQHKVIVNASPHLLVANCTSEVLRGSLEMEVDIGEIKKSFESFEGLQVSDEIIERSGYVRPEQESKMGGEAKIYTQHGLQVQSQERKLYEQVQVSLTDFDRLVEASELQNRSKVYEKQSQVDNFCAELHSYMLNAEGDTDTLANGMDIRKRKRGRPKKKAAERGSAFSIDIKKADCEKEFASDAMNKAAEHLASGSRKRVQSGFPCSALEEDAGVHVSSSSRKRVCSGLSRGAAKDGNGLGVKSQFYHRKFSSQAVTLEGKEVSSDASVAGDIIAKPTEAAKDRVINEKCKVDVTERVNVAPMAFYAKENMANSKNERDALRQMSCMKEQKLLPADDFLESWKNRLPNGWKVEVGLQRTESGKYDYYHKFVSPDGVQFPELKEISKNESSVCGQENDVKGFSGANEIEFCNISPPGYGYSNQRTDISYEEDRNEESNTSSKQGSPETMSIPSDLDEARVEANTYVCKFCGKNFNCYRHYVGHVAAHALTSHTKRGRLRVRGKVPLLKKEEDKDDRIISNENFQTTNVNESDNSIKLKKKVGRPRISYSDRHKEMNCNTGIQSGSVMFYVNQTGSKGNVNEPQNSNIIDLDSGHAILSSGALALVNTAGPRKPGRARKIKEPICGCCNRDDDMRHTNNDRDDFVDSDCGHDKQSTGTLWLVNTKEPKRKRGRPRIVGVKRKHGRPRIVKKKPGRVRKVQGPICSNDSHDNEKNHTNIDRDEADNSLRSCQDVEENLSVCEQSAGFQTSIDRDACEMIDGSPRYEVKTQDEVHYFIDTDCDNAMQSAGTPLLVQTVGTKRKTGRPRTVRPKRKLGRPRKIKEPICSNDNHDNDRNYGGNDRDEANNSFRSYQDVEENLSGFKQSAGFQTDIVQDACEKKDDPPRCGDKTQDGVHCFADTDCCYAMPSVGTPTLVNRVEAKRRRGRPRKNKEPICGSNHDDERNCTGNDRDEANNSFSSYKDVKENLSICKQFAGLQTSIDQDACEKKDGLPRYGHKTPDEVHYENGIKSAGALVFVDQNGLDNWAGQQRLRDDNKDTVGDLASADTSLKRDDRSRLKDEMQAKDMDCINHSQPHGAEVLVTQVGESKKLGWSSKFQAPICSDSKPADEINKYSSSCNQDEERHCQCDNVKDEMRIGLDGELNSCKIDESIHVMAPAIWDRSENFIGMQKLGKICQDEEMPRGKTFQYVGLVTNVDLDDQNKWFEQPRVKDDRQDVEPSDRINQLADSKNPVDSTSPLLENINLDSTLQKYGIYQNINKTTYDYFAEAGTLYPLLPAVNKGRLDPNKTATGGNAKVSFVDHEIERDTSQFVFCQWCDQDFDFSSVSHPGSPCSWICPGCKTVNKVDVQNLWTDFEF